MTCPERTGVGGPASQPGLRGRGGSTFANQPSTVVEEAHRALAAEAPNLIDADATGTDGGDLPALVDVWGGRQCQGQPGPWEHLGTLS